VLSLPESGARCTASSVNSALRRSDIWQAFTVETRSPRRTISLSLDSKQRIKMLMVMGPTVFSTTFDTTGQVSPFSRTDPVTGERARLLANAVRERCAPLPPVEGLGQPIPPAPHTTVFARIATGNGNDSGNCRIMPSVNPQLRADGVVTATMLALRYPFRNFVVGVDAKGALRTFSTSVAWGGMSRAETESADARFTADGALVSGTKFWGYIGTDGKGAHYPLMSPELDSIRALASDVLKRCHRAP